MLSPDEDGTPFHRPPGISGKVIGTALKIETPQTDEMDERPINVKEEESETVIKSEKDEPLPQPELSTELSKPSSNKDGDDPIIEKVLYTHAHGHTCTRKNCNPIILSKRGIIKPDRPNTTHYHLGGSCSEGGEKLLPPGSELKTPKTEESTEHEEDEHHKPLETNNVTTKTTSSDNITQLKTPDTERNEHPPEVAMTSTVLDNAMQSKITETETTNEKDEHTLEAAGGLLMLQNIDIIGDADNETEYDPYDNSKVVPVSNEPALSHERDEHQTTNDIQTDTVIDDTVLPDLDEPPKPPEKEASSDDTIIYDPPNLGTTANTASTLKEESATRKGTLTIREIGIPKPGKSTEQTNSDVMPVITTSGKVRCDFCKRAFNTITEQKQHMARRHLAQLQEKKERLQREKDEQETQENEKQHKGAPDREERDKNEKADSHRRKKDTEKDEQTTVQEKKKSRSIKSDTKPRSRSRIPSKNTSGTTRKRKRSNEKDEHETSKPKKDKRKNVQQKVHTKQQPVNRKQANERHRIYNCPFCDNFYDTQSELNHHHKQKHPPVQCTVCKQLCATPNTLARHMYKHKERKFSCQYCDEKFAFKSEVEIHMANHQGDATHFCRKCTKSFQRIGELREHEQTHTNKLLYCPKKGCSFSGKLKRYIRTHLQTTHADEENLPYQCKYKKCDRSFKFYEQRKRHYNNDH